MGRRLRLGVPDLYRKYYRSIGIEKAKLLIYRQVGSPNGYPLRRLKNQSLGILHLYWFNTVDNTDIFTSTFTAAAAVIYLLHQSQLFQVCAGRLNHFLDFYIHYITKSIATPVFTRT